MDKNELLTEGYLSAYITGETSEKEAHEIEQLIASNSEVAQEYLELQKTLELLSFNYSISAKPDTKRALMESNSVISHANHSEHVRTESTWKYALAASITLAMISTFAAFYFWNQWVETDDRLADATIRSIEMAESYQNVNQELDGFRQDLAIAASPAFSRIILSGTDNVASAKTIIYWNSENEEVYLNSGNLTSLNEDQQYQLWALVGGTPIDMGTFDAQEGRFQVMKTIGVADAFAVTIEQAGGAVSPTLSTMQVYGEV